MTNNGNLSSIPKSFSTGSLNKPLSSEQSLLSSTRNPVDEHRIYIDRHRRKAIVPTPNRPILRHNQTTMDPNNDNPELTLSNDSKNSRVKSADAATSLIMNDNPLIKAPSVTFNTDTHLLSNVSSFLERCDNSDRTDIDINFFREEPHGVNPKATHQSFQSIEQINQTRTGESQKQAEDNPTDTSFDAFIIQHFTPFSGKQNVIKWLDGTEKTFNRFRIERSLRYDAISLLVEHDAKRIYVKHRKEIQSFDDFYEFLLTHFDDSHASTHLSQSASSASATNSSKISAPKQIRTFDDSQCKTLNITEATYINSQTPNFCSTAMVDIGTTNSFGVNPAGRPTAGADNSSSFASDQTMNDLRKAIVGNLIRNPKTFRGGKDDVKKWIEDIEHLLDLAHIPDSTRLDLISYSLRGDALEWFKNSRTSLTSWSVFVTEVKRAFISSFHEEVAFQKLETYTQQENQSIRNFVNEVLKLCREADSTMSESSKLKNLLNKTRPSIQFEVRKKKPRTTAEFLEYAREIEELFQLSNLSLGDTLQTSVSAQQTTPPPLMSNSSGTDTQSTSYSKNNSSHNYGRQFNPTKGPSNNRNFVSNSKPFKNNSSYSAPKFTPSDTRYQSTPTSNYRTNSSPAGTGQSYSKPKQNQYNSSHTPNYHPSSANTIQPSYPSNDEQPSEEPSEEYFSSIVCLQCGELGHEASACPNF